MPNAFVMRGMIMPGSVFVSPMLLSMSYSGMSVTWNGSMSSTRMSTSTTPRPRNSSRASA